MTEKELLYVEDAIGHEDSIIAYLKDAMNGLEDKNLVSFVKNEVKKHENVRCKLLDILKENADE